MLLIHSYISQIDLIALIFFHRDFFIARLDLQINDARFMRVLFLIKSTLLIAFALV